MRDELQGVLEELLIDADGGAEQLTAFAQAFRTSVRFPFAASVVGSPVPVASIVFEGDERRGLVAVCRRDGREYRVSVVDLTPGLVTAETALLLAAYRRWCGLEPLERDEQPVPEDQSWVYRTLASTPVALAQPLELRPDGHWDPVEEYWGDLQDDPHPLISRIISAGPRPAFEMEQVLPGTADDDWDLDPVADAAELHPAGADREATRILRGLIAEDERCIDAWVHLGNIAFHKRGPTAALEFYDRAVAIGEQTITAGFAGVLPWGLIDNRPFHRALYGLGLCAWRQRRCQDAEDIFTGRCWLQGTGGWDALSCLEQVRARRRWTKE